MSDEQPPQRHTREEIDAQIQRTREKAPNAEYLKKVRRFGMHRYYDLDAVMNASVDLNELDLRTWEGDEAMKRAIVEVRDSMHKLERLMYRRYFDD